MIFKIGLDVLEDDILAYSPRLLDILLSDKSSHANIIWATDDYASLGDEYGADQPITVGAVTGEHTRLIRPRISKTIEEQDSRTKYKAEVFTPCWVCNGQNNLVDAAWFGRQNVFNVEDGEAWITCLDRIAFPDSGKKSWKTYVDARRLEITCGEAPYLVSRYDTVTGAMIEIPERIGLLDRKLRVVSESADSVEDWNKWALRAFQSVYGYEYQGDSLLLARENLLATYVEYFRYKFQKDPELKMVLKIANVISWNIWQMDGQKYVIPNSCHPVDAGIVDYFGFGINDNPNPCPGCKTDDVFRHNGIYCKVMDWRAKESMLFLNMVKGAKS